jgi:hypothetical protein
MTERWAKFNSAVRRLTGVGSIKERLHEAYFYNLYDLQSSDLPYEIHNDFEALKRAMTSEEPLGTETRVEAAMRKMYDSDAIKWIGEIVTMYDIVARYEGPVTKK